MSDKLEELNRELLISEECRFIQRNKIMKLEKKIDKLKAKNQKLRIKVNQLQDYISKYL